MAFATAGWFQRTSRDHRPASALRSRPDRLPTAHVGAGANDRAPDPFMLEKTFDSTRSATTFASGLSPQPDGIQLGPLPRPRRRHSLRAPKGFMHHVSPDLPMPARRRTRPASCRLRPVRRLHRSPRHALAYPPAPAKFSAPTARSASSTSNPAAPTSGCRLHRCSPLPPSNKFYRYLRKEILTVQQPVARQHPLRRIRPHAPHGPGLRRRALHRADMQSGKATCRNRDQPVPRHGPIRVAIRFKCADSRRCSPPPHPLFSCARALRTLCA
jgi:hypothetical protein